MSERHINVCTEVVAHDLCVGCGVCAGVCPSGTLGVEINRLGEYVATDVKGTCAAECEMCLSVCPFGNSSAVEDVLGGELFGQIAGVSHSLEAGYYLGCWAGHSKGNGHRASGASGGLATWTLERLLADGQVDHVVCAGPVPESDKLAEYVICDTAEQVRVCAKSWYYPVETSGIIRRILENNGRYAAIGVPCFLKGIRRAMQLLPKLRERIIYLLGLTCGQAKGAFFAEYVCSLGGADPRYLKEFTFRVKDGARPASDFGMRYVCDDGRGGHQQGVIYWTEGIDHAWNQRYFTPNACDYCDDIFAELADITFMDAWLTEYSSDPGGTNLVIVRDERFEQMLQQAAGQGQIEIGAVDIDSVIRSQKSVVAAKRDKLALRLALARKLRLYVPAKRTEPLRKASLGQLLRAYLEKRIGQRSKIAFLRQKEEGAGLALFERQMSWYHYLLTLLSRIERVKGRFKRSWSRKNRTHTNK